MPPEPLPSALQYGSVCSGIEAVSLAWNPLGLRAAWFSEIDPFACAVLAHRYPDVPNLGDMTTLADRVRAGTVAAPDILAGGTPCQAFSIAGKRAGMTDPRGALTLSYVELANVIDQTRLETNRPPAILVWENVPGVLSDRANAFGCLLGALAGEDCALEPPGGKWTHAGDVSGPQRRLAWRVLDAQYFGVAQRRRRVFLVASGRNGFDPATVLFEREGVPGHPAPGGQARQGIAPTLAARARGGGGLGTDFDCDGGLIPVASTLAFGSGNTHGSIDVAAALLAASGHKFDFDSETFVVQSVAGAISHTLGAANGGKGCSEDGTGRGTPIVTMAFEPRHYTRAKTGGSPSETVTLTSHSNAGDSTPCIVQPVAAHQSMAFAQNSRGEVRLESGHGQLAGALSTGGGKPGQGMPMVLSLALRGRAEGNVAELGTGIAPALRTASGGANKSYVLLPCDETDLGDAVCDPAGALWDQWRVRRLMPVECERLQGMPDHWTLVPYRGKPAADSPRYKAIGNSMAVPCVAWLGRRLLEFL